MVNDTNHPMNLLVRFCIITTSPFILVIL